MRDVNPRRQDDEPERTAPWVLHHVGVAVTSIEQAVPVYQEIFGYRVLSGPFADPIQRVSVCFMGSGVQGEPPTELIAPASEDSPVASVLRKAIGAYHVCYEVDDVEAALGFVRSRGCVVIGRSVPAAAFGGRHIGWFYTPTRQLIELLEVQKGAECDGDS